MSDYDHWFEALDEELLAVYGVPAGAIPGFDPRDHFYEHDDDHEALQAAVDEAGAILDDAEVAIAMLLGIFIGGA